MTVEPDEITHRVRALFTDEQHHQLTRNYQSPDQDHKPLVRLSMTMSNGNPLTMLLYIVDPQYPELATCLCDYGNQQVFRELVNMRHIMELSDEAIVPLSKDESFQARYPISVYERAGETHQGLTSDPHHLAQANRDLKREYEAASYRS